LSFDYRIAATAMRGAALFFAFTRIPDDISDLKRQRNRAYLLMRGAIRLAK
jgi:hypothetical protein